MAESSPSSSITASAEEEAANDLLATKEILQGLKDGLTRRAAALAAHQDKIPLTPKTRDELLQESFPMIPTSSSNDKDDVKPDLTTEECIALRIGLQNIIHSDVKRKMSLLQEQLSEYHTILEDVIAYKTKYEQLEEDKQNLTRICRETCKVRDERIELLEKEVGRLRRLNEEQQQQLRLRPRICSVISSRNDSSTSHDERSAQGGQPGPQAYPDFNPQQHLYHRTQSGMLTMVNNNSYHSSYHQPYTTMEPSQRVSPTPPAAAAMATTTNSHDNNNMAMDPNCTTGFNIAAFIQPLPFQRRRLPPSSSHHDAYSSRYYGSNKKSRQS